MVWPTSCDGVAIGQGMVGRNCGQVNRNAISSREGYRNLAYSVQRWTCENVLEWLPPRRSIPGISATLPCTPAGRPLCPIPRGRICTTLLFWNTISPNFLNVSRPHVRQFINTEHRKDILSLRRTPRG